MQNYQANAIGIIARPTRRLYIRAAAQQDLCCRVVGSAATQRQLVVARLAEGAGNCTAVQQSHQAGRWQQLFGSNDLQRSAPPIVR